MRLFSIDNSYIIAFIAKSKQVMYAVILALLPVITNAQTAIFQPASSDSSKSIFFLVSQQLQKSREIQAKTYLINENSSPNAAKSWLKKHNIKHIITLGSRSLKFAKSIPNIKNTNIIAGGVTNIPQGNSGVSLTTSPSAFFKLLKLFAPQVRKVSLVYSQDKNGWWIKEAKQQAINNNIVLSLYPSESIKAGVRSYKHIVDKAKKGKEAIWIPLVDLVPNKIIMSIVLKTAWVKEMVVFSNNPAHVKQGALFSLYPDNNSLSKQLISIVKALKTQQKTIVAPTKQVKSAINVRTAKRLGLKLSSAELLQFDRIYPNK